MKTKLIIVTGMSGAGKSTTAQQVAKQYKHNKVPYVWLHEEIRNHPIRDGEFSVASRETEEGMDQNVEEMYSRWSKLADEIAASDKVYVMEGCLYQNIIRYFFDCHYPIEKITLFYDRVMDVLAKLNPTIVFLYRSDVKASFQKAFKIRGDRWKNIILDQDDVGYFSKHEYTGEESIYAMWESYQEVSNAMFERYQGNKIKLLTSDGEWDKHIRNLTEYLGLDYIPATIHSIENPEQYCGRYTVEFDGKESWLEIKLVDGELLGQVYFWSNLKLIPLGNHEFEVQSFPAEFAFNLDGPKKSVTVKGIYGWRISGKTLWEV